MYVSVDVYVACVSFLRVLFVGYCYFIAAGASKNVEI